MNIKYIQPQEIKQINNAFIIDVRDSDYNHGGHYRRSVNIPISTLKKQTNIKQIENFNNIICFCMQSMQRGPYFAKEIKNLYPTKTVFVVEGGYLNISDQVPDECSQLDSDM